MLQNNFIRKSPFCLEVVFFYFLGFSFIFDRKESFKELDDLFQISERMQKEKKLIRKWVEEIERNGKEPKTGSQKIKKALGKVMKMEKAKKIEDLAQAIRLNIFYFMRTNTS